MTEVNYRPDAIDVLEDYGDAWRVIVKPGELAGRTFVGWISQTGNPLVDPAAASLTITPHETEADWFYVGQDAALVPGFFRVVTTDADQFTILTGILQVL